MCSIFFIWSSLLVLFCVLMSQCSSRHTSPNSCSIVFKDNFLPFSDLKSICVYAQWASALILVGLSSSKKFFSFHESISFITSFLCFGRTPSIIPLSGLPARFLVVDTLLFASFLFAFFTVFFPCFLTYFLLSFLLLLKFIIKNKLNVKISKSSMSFLNCKMKSEKSLGYYSEKID